MRELKERTQQFALDVIRFCARLAPKPEFRIISRQLMRSATSVGANYRSARRAKSNADFIAKMAIVEEEADESLYWMELLQQLHSDPDGSLGHMMDEANQLVSIVVASKKTARRNQ